MGRHRTILVLAATLLLFAQACYTQHKVETVHKIEVAPMHITIDVNVKVDKALDDFFGDLDKTEEQIQKQ
jgi:Spy/CpxP family protein refolding chaperone